MNNPQKTENFSLTIRPARAWYCLNWKELWSYRELFFFVALRDIRLRYKQTILGVAWALLQPLFTMIVFTIFFGKLANIPTDSVPYSLFALTGLVPWMFFANGIGFATGSVVGEANMIKKIYFPRVIIPVSSICAGFVDLIVASLMVLPFLFYHHMTPSLHLLLFPVLALLLFIVTAGVGLWLSALNVLFRDVRYVVPFLVQLWMFSTPIAYPASLLSASWRVIYGVNPMVGVVEGFRWMVLGTTPDPNTTLLTLLVSCSVALVLFATGLLYFHKIEKSFADVV